MHQIGLVSSVYAKWPSRAALNFSGVARFRRMSGSRVIESGSCVNVQLCLMECWLQHTILVAGQTGQIYQAESES